MVRTRFGEVQHVSAFFFWGGLWHGMVGAFGFLLFFSQLSVVATPMATASAWVGHGWSFLSSGSAYGQRGMGDGGRYPFTAIHFLGFSFFPPVFWFPSRWVTRFGPSLGGPGDDLTFLVSFFTDAADDGPGGETVSRRWWRVCFQITYLFLFWPLPQKYTLESGTRRTERNRLPRMHSFLGFHFPELRDS